MFGMQFIGSTALQPYGGLKESAEARKDDPIYYYYYYIGSHQLALTYTQSTTHPMHLIMTSCTHRQCLSCMSSSCSSTYCTSFTSCAVCPQQHPVLRQAWRCNGLSGHHLSAGHALSGRCSTQRHTKLTTRVLSTRPSWTDTLNSELQSYRLVDCYIQSITVMSDGLRRRQAHNAVGLAADH